MGGHALTSTDSLVGRYIAEDGRTADVVARDGQLSLEHNGRRIHPAQVVAWDRAGRFEWWSAETREWFARAYERQLTSLRTPAIVALTGVVLLVLAWAARLMTMFLLGGPIFAPVPEPLLTASMWSIRIGAILIALGAVWAAYRQLTREQRLLGEPRTYSPATQLEPAPRVTTQTAEKVTPVGRRWGNITLVVAAILIVLWMIGLLNSPAMRHRSESPSSSVFTTDPLSPKAASAQWQQTLKAVRARVASRYRGWTYVSGLEPSTRPSWEVSVELQWTGWDGTHRGAPRPVFTRVAVPIADGGARPDDQWIVPVLADADSMEPLVDALLARLGNQGIMLSVTSPNGKYPLATAAAQEYDVAWAPMTDPTNLTHERWSLVRTDGTCRWTPVAPK